MSNARLECEIKEKQKTLTTENEDLKNDITNVKKKHKEQVALLIERISQLEAAIWARPNLTRPRKRPSTNTRASTKAN